MGKLARVGLGLLPRGPWCGLRLARRPEPDSLLRGVLSHYPFVRRVVLGLVSYCSDEQTEARVGK